MNLLCLYQGLYGQRIIKNLHFRAPYNWQISELELPRVLPVIVDEPEEFLPPELPSADLLLHMGEASQAAQLLPDTIQLTGARAVIAPIDNDTWIPTGLRRQLRRELNSLGAAIVFPVPFCALTEDLIISEHILEPKQLDVLMGFVRHFGRPRLRIIPGNNETISAVIVERGASCGSSQYAAERLRGIPLAEAVPQGGLICLHYPCLASMQPTKPQAGVENLMHLSGVIFNEELEMAIKNAARQAE